jgi:hypothetical protein
MTQTQTELTHMDTLEKEKADVQHIETQPEQLYLERFPLLRGKTDEELAVLNKKLLRTLDYRFLPTVTMMLLMGYFSFYTQLHNMS